MKTFDSDDDVYNYIELLTDGMGIYLINKDYNSALKKQHHRQDVYLKNKTRIILKDKLFTLSFIQCKHKFIG